MTRQLTPDERARREAWLQEVGEASVLPAESPARLAVETEVARRGGWALAYWEALLEEGDAWRASLDADVPPPGDLVARLKAIAVQHTQAAMAAPARALWPRLAWTAAAVLIAALGAWAVAGSLGSEPRRDAALEDVALLALNDHLDTHEQKVHADNPAALALALQPFLPFDVRMPVLGADVRPVGGRRCTLGSHTVAFTAWRAPRGRLTLLQLQRHDFGLPADMAPHVITPSGAAAKGRPLDVLFFGHGDTVWVVVADDAEDLRLVRRAIGNS